MLSKTFSVIFRNWIFYAWLIVCGLAASIFDEYMQKNTLNNTMLIVWILLALYVHVAVLYQTDFGGILKKQPMVQKKFFPFTWRFLVLGGIALATAFVGTLLLLGGFKSLGGGHAQALFLLIYLLIFAIIYISILALVGTWLPAAVFGEKTTFRDAIARGWPVFFPTFWHLLFATMAFEFVSLAVVFGGVALLPSGILLRDGTPNIPMMLVVSLSLLLQAVAITYVAVVLSSVYLSREDITSATASNPTLAA